MLRKILFLLLTCLSAGAQKLDSARVIFRIAENELYDLQKPVFYSKKEKERFEANRAFISRWDSVVTNPAILDYDFTSLKEISILRSANHRVMVITWNVPKDDGTHIYFGYLLVKDEKRIRKGFLNYVSEYSYGYYKLTDRSALVKSPETYTGTHDKWFGMLYTQLIECDGYYTLIGWDGNDRLTQKKFIDVLYFKSDGTPVFGKDVFRFPRKNPRRLMFEYSTEVTMSVKYNERNGSIVVSHLAANSEGNLLEGQPQYYGPDGSFDALVQKSGKWVLVEDVDARNERSPNDGAEKPDPKKQTPLYRPKRK